MSGWDHGSVGTLGGDVHVVQCDVEAGGIRRKGKPAARRGRKATGPTRSAELPNDRERACSEHTRWRSPRDCPPAACVRPASYWTTWATTPPAPADTTSSTARRPTQDAAPAGDAPT